MTVKIVGHKKQKSRRKTCENCTAILQFVPADVEYVKTSHCGELCTDGWIKCAECKKDVKVSCDGGWT